ncbi:hypothetical protein FB567DRAFT_590112 [Paraphoma chrysanthemicola]|uniref:Uncharacterized protein n=1 Tax=Paraphoma chrysanthemicola TaxID=798071 RepID=A0A8K0W164_9PLEO|nr:hypothetical protein FB567DRAFT_590112 [Paraphoma chrysanthemicola]
MFTKVVLFILLAGLASAAPLDARGPTEIGNTNIVIRASGPDGLLEYRVGAQADIKAKKVKREAQGDDNQPWGEAQNADNEPWGTGKAKRNDGEDHDPWGCGKLKGETQRADDEPWGTE